MEGFLCNEKDFIGKFRLGAMPCTFDIYKDKLIVMIPTGDVVGPHDPSIFTPENIRDVVIKRSLIGLGYNIF